MVYEELRRVGSLVDAREGEDGEPRRTAPDPIDQLGEFPPRLHLGHPPLQQACQWLGNHAGGANWVGFPDPEMGRQIMSVPALAEVGASGPRASSRSHSSARSDLAKVTRDHPSRDESAQPSPLLRQGQRHSATGYRVHQSGREAVGGMRSPRRLSAGTMGPVTKASSAPTASGSTPIASLLKRDAAGLVTAVIQEQATERC